MATTPAAVSRSRREDGAADPSLWSFSLFAPTAFISIRRTESTRMSISICTAARSHLFLSRPIISTLRPHYAHTMIDFMLPLSQSCTILVANRLLGLPSALPRHANTSVGRPTAICATTYHGLLFDPEAEVIVSPWQLTAYIAPCDVIDFALT